jgi:F0F1-type ATP synthase membrane subunit b/b'
MIFFQSAILLICGFTLWTVAYITHRIERFIMSTQEAIDAIVTQLGKAKDEVVAKIADVQAQLDAANVPAEVVNLSALTAAAQALDDIVPDAPVTPSV